MRIKLIFIFTIFCCLQAEAQERMRLQIYLKNGDRITGYTELQILEFQTRYGTLNIPLKDLRHLQLGVPVYGSPDPSIARKIRAIQSGTINEARAAFDSLSTGDERLAAQIKQYIQDPAYTPRPHPEINLDALLDILCGANGLLPSFSLEDRLKLANGNLLEGRCNRDLIQLESAWGRISADRASIVMITKDMDPMKSPGEYELPASFYISGRGETGYLNTGIVCKAGQTVHVQCSGSVVLQTLSGKTFYADGASNTAMPAASTQNENNIPYGAVELKVGMQGNPVFALKAQGYKAVTTGLVYLSIHESAWSAGNTGSYSCRVKVD